MDEYHRPMACTGTEDSPHEEIQWIARSKDLEICFFCDQPGHYRLGIYIPDPYSGP